MKENYSPYHSSKLNATQNYETLYLQEILVPYTRHHNLLILTIHKVRILRKKPLEKTFWNFKKWVKIIQTAGYNGRMYGTLNCQTSLTGRPGARNL